MRCTLPLQASQSLERETITPTRGLSYSLCLLSIHLGSLDLLFHFFAFVFFLVLLNQSLDEVNIFKRRSRAFDEKRGASSAAPPAVVRLIMWI